MIPLNLEILAKSKLVPLKAFEKSILLVIAMHVAKGKNSCFPSYERIEAQSGTKAIKQVIDLLASVGVIKYRHRGDIGDGKENNEYQFVFNGIDFYKDKIGEFRLSQDNTKGLKERIGISRERIRKQRELEKAERAKKPNKPNNDTEGCLRTDNALLPNTPVEGVSEYPSGTVNHKPQKPVHGVCATKGSTGSTNTPAHRANTPVEGGRKNREIAADQKELHESGDRGILRSCLDDIDGGTLSPSPADSDISDLSYTDVVCDDATMVVEI